MGELAPVVAIDGPSGTGKGTLASHLQRWLGWHLLDSGAFYRLAALSVLERGTDPMAADEIARIAAEMSVEFEAVDGAVQIRLGGRDVTATLRSEACGAAASKVAALPLVRAALLERQRAFLRPPGLVADGRDMGTVVFPDAEIKIFLTASPAERARRRYKQLKGKGMSVNLAQLSGDIADRDRRDEEREISPLRPAPDAFILDTTRLEIRAVEDRIKRLVEDSGLV